MRFKLGVQFEGTGFFGWQVQPGQKTIQGEIEKAIKTVTSEKVSVVASGRTDAGVHARLQFAHVDISSQVDEKLFLRNVNALLPEEIRILTAVVADEDFHALRSAKWKTYIYLIEEAPVLRPHFRNFVHYRFARTDAHPGSEVFKKYPPLDIEKMNAASELLKGEHDFLSFRGKGAADGPTVKTIHKAQWSESKIEESGGRVLQFEVSGNGFLKQMVRNLVGTLIEVGEGKRPVEGILSLIEAKDRNMAGPTAPAKGLMLHKVSYLEY